MTPWAEPILRVSKISCHQWWVETLLVVRTRARTIAQDDVIVLSRRVMLMHLGLRHHNCSTACSSRYNLQLSFPDTTGWLLQKCHDVAGMQCRPSAFTLRDLQ